MLKAKYIDSSYRDRRYYPMSLDRLPQTGARVDPDVEECRRSDGRQ